MVIGLKGSYDNTFNGSKIDRGHVANKLAKMEVGLKKIPTDESNKSKMDDIRMGLERQY